MPRLLLGLRAAVIGCSSEKSSAIGQCDTAAGRMIRTVLGPVALHRNNSTDFQIVFAPPNSAQIGWRSSLKSPICNLSVGVLHVHVNPDVRVRPLKLGHCSGNGK